MRFRRVDIAIAAASLAVGAALAPGTVSGDAGRLLITFLGLVSASVLPTISLILGSMTTSGRSVKALDELEVELRLAIDALFFLFGLVALAVIALVALAIEPPIIVEQLRYLHSIMHRSGQGLVVAVTVMIGVKAGQIPAIIRRTLTIRHQIAVAEARRKTRENAPQPGEVRAFFETHPDFGKTVPVSEPRDRDPH